MIDFKMIRAEKLVKVVESKGENLEVFELRLIVIGPLLALLVNIHLLNVLCIEILKVLRYVPNKC